MGGASFFRPPTEVMVFFEEPESPGILRQILSPCFNEKSLPTSLLDYKLPEAWIFTILSCFLKSSRPAMKSKESFLSGNPTPTIAFWPFSLERSNAKNLDESVHL